MATREQLIDALKKADAAGNTEDAKKLANYIKSSSGAFGVPNQQREGTAGFFEGVVGGAKNILSGSQTAVEAPFISGEEAALRGIERQKGRTERPGFSLDEIIKTYDQDGLFSAAGETLSQIPGAIGEQLPFLASMKAGFAAGSALPLPPQAKLLAGVAGSLLTPFLVSSGSAMERKASEQLKRGDKVDINELGAYGTGLASAGLERAALGLSGLSKVMGIDFLKGAGTETAEQIARRSLAATLARGGGKLVAAEVPTEMGQQALERYYAGLSLTDEEAMREYAEAGAGAAMLAPLGMAGSAYQRSQVRKDIKKKEEGIQKENERIKREQEAELKRKEEEKEITETAAKLERQRIEQEAQERKDAIEAELQRARETGEPVKSIQQIINEMTGVVQDPLDEKQLADIAKIDTERDRVFSQLRANRDLGAITEDEYKGKLLFLDEQVSKAKKELSQKQVKERKPLTGKKLTARQKQFQEGLDEPSGQFVAGVDGIERERTEAEAQGIPVQEYDPTKQKLTKEFITSKKGLGIVGTAKAFGLDHGDGPVPRLKDFLEAKDPTNVEDNGMIRLTLNENLKTRRKGLDDAPSLEAQQKRQEVITKIETYLTALPTTQELENGEYQKALDAEAARRGDEVDDGTAAVDAFISSVNDTGGVDQSGAISNELARRAGPEPDSLVDPETEQEVDLTGALPKEEFDAKQLEADNKEIEQKEKEIKTKENQAKIGKNRTLRSFLYETKLPRSDMNDIMGETSGKSKYLSVFDGKKKLTPSPSLMSLIEGGRVDKFLPPDLRLEADRAVDTAFDAEPAYNYLAERMRNQQEVIEFDVANDIEQEQLILNNMEESVAKSTGAVVEINGQSIPKTLIDAYKSRKPDRDSTLPNLNTSDYYRELQKYIGDYYTDKTLSDLENLIEEYVKSQPQDLRYVVFGKIKGTDIETVWQEKVGGKQRAEEIAKTLEQEGKATDTRVQEYDLNQGSMGAESDSYKREGLINSLKELESTIAKAYSKTPLPRSRPDQLTVNNEVKKLNAKFENEIKEAYGPDANRDEIEMSLETQIKRNETGGQYDPQKVPAQFTSGESLVQTYIKRQAQPAATPTQEQTQTTAPAATPKTYTFEGKKIPQKLIDQYRKMQESDAVSARAMSTRSGTIISKNFLKQAQEFLGGKENAITLTRGREFTSLLSRIIRPGQSATVPVSVDGTIRTNDQGKQDPRDAANFEDVQEAQPAARPTQDNIQESTTETEAIVPMINGIEIPQNLIDTYQDLDRARRNAFNEDDNPQYKQLRKAAQKEDNRFDKELEKIFGKDLEGLNFSEMLIEQGVSVEAYDNKKFRQQAVEDAITNVLKGEPIGTKSEDYYFAPNNYIEPVKYKIDPIQKETEEQTGDSTFYKKVDDIQESRTETEQDKLAFELREAEYQAGSYIKASERVPKRLRDRIKKLKEQLSVQESRSDTLGPIETVDSIIESLRKEFGSDIDKAIDSGQLVIVNNLSELPNNFNFAPTANGAYDPRSNKVYIVASKVMPGQGRKVLLHELGEHYGLERMLGDSYGATLGRLNSLKNTDPKVKAIWDQVGRQYPDIEVGGKLYLQEVMAKIGEQSPQNTLFKRVVAAVKNFLRKLGFFNPNTLTTADMQDLIMYSTRSALAKSDKVTASQLAAGQSPDIMFSKTDVPAGLEQTSVYLSGVKDDSKTFYNNFVDVIGKVFNNPAESLPSLWNQIRIKMVSSGAGIERKLLNEYEGAVTDSLKRVRPDIIQSQAIDDSVMASQSAAEGKVVFGEDRVARVVVDENNINNLVKLRQQLADQTSIEFAEGLIQSYTSARRYRLELDRVERREANIARLNKSLSETRQELKTAKGKDRRAKEALMDKYKKEISRDTKKNESINITPEQEAAIEPGLAYAQQYPLLVEVGAMIDAINKNRIDLLEDSGIYTKDMADDYRDREGYVPLFREMIEDISKGDEVMTQYITGFADIGREYAFTGSDKNSKHILGNILQQHFWAVSASLRNNANLEVAKQVGLTDEKGELKIYEKNPETGTAAPVMIEGKRKFIEYSDPALAIGIQGALPVYKGILKYFGIAAKWFRLGITANPVFQTYQVINDALGAAMYSGVKSPLKLGKEIIGGYVRDQYFRDTKAIDDQMARLGIAGGFGRTPGDIFLRAQRQLGVENMTKWQKLVDFTDAFASRSDLAQRRGIFVQTLLESGGVRQADGSVAGGNEIEAMNRALNIINWQKRGASSSVRTMTHIIPFANAYLQGMDVLLNAMAGKGLSGTDAQTARILFLKTALSLTMFNMLYSMVVAGEEEYDELDDRIKFRNYIVPGTGFKLPVRAEISLLTKYIPEQAYQYVTKLGTTNEVDATKLFNGMSLAVRDAAMGPNLFPQLIRGSVEVATNYNFYTGRPLVGLGLSRLDTAEQYNEATSELAKLLGSTGMVAPINADHIIRSYFGTVGSTALFVIDQAANTMIGNEKPAMRLKDFPLISPLLYSAQGRDKLNDFYELKQASDEATATANRLMKYNPRKAAEYRKDNAKMLRTRTQVNTLSNTLKDLRARRKLIIESGMDGDKKRAALTNVEKQMNNVASNIARLRIASGL